MSKARQLADLGNQIDDGAINGTNLIINGAMNVCQRSVSATGIGTAVSYNTVDRWRFADASNPTGRFTQTQSTDAPDGFGFSHKFEVTTADTGVDADEMQYTDQFIEAQDLQVLKYGTSSAKSFTFSFYVKCSVASTMGLRFTHEDGGGSYGTSYTINAANVWERKSVTIQGNTATAINNDNGRGLRIAFGLTVGTDNAGTDSTAWGNGNVFGAHTNAFVGTSGATWQVTGVCLSVGDSAIDFPHESYGETLAKCQRYCQKIETGTDAGFGVYHSYTASSAYAPIQLPVTMRATPSASITDGNAVTLFTGGTNFNPTSTSFINASPSSVEVRFTTTGNATAGDTGWYRLQTAFTMILNAEL